jgi:hypothetical protein
MGCAFVECLIKEDLYQPRMGCAIEKSQSTQPIHPKQLMKKLIQSESLQTLKFTFNPGRNDSDLQEY